MKAARFVLLCAIVIWCAGGCQQALAPKIAVFGAVPDFLVVSSACLALFSHRWGAGVIGFFAGLVQGALAGANLAAYVASRSVAAFLVGWFASFELDKSPLLGFLMAAIATLVGQLLLMFIAPPAGIVPFLLATIATAIYNGVIAVPVFALLRRILEPPQR